MMKKYQFFFALFALITGLSTAMLAQIKNGSGIRDVDFSNLSYRTTFGDPGEAKTIKLKSGKFEANGKYEEGGQLYELFGKPAFGDLNGDKTEDAVIEISLAVHLVTVPLKFRLTHCKREMQKCWRGSTAAKFSRIISDTIGRAICIMLELIRPKYKMEASLSKH